MNTDKKKNLYNLRHNISLEAQRISFLPENVIEGTKGNMQANVLAGLALEKSIRIEKLSKKIGKILKC